MKMFNSNFKVGNFESYEELRKFHKKFPEFTIYHEDFTFIPFEHNIDNVENKPLHGYYAITVADNPDSASGIGEYLVMWMSDWKNMLV